MHRVEAPCPTPVLLVLLLLVLLFDCHIVCLRNGNICMCAVRDC
jgi:hypothetical protein